LREASELFLVIVIRDDSQRSGELQFCIVVTLLPPEQDLYTPPVITTNVTDCPKSNVKWWTPVEPRAAEEVAVAGDATPPERVLAAAVRVQDDSAREALAEGVRARGAPRPPRAAAVDEEPPVDSGQDRRLKYDRELGEGPRGVWDEMQLRRARLGQGLRRFQGAKATVDSSVGWADYSAPVRQAKGTQPRRRTPVLAGPPSLPGKVARANPERVLRMAWEFLDLSFLSGQ
jgi:hypothetical protein